MAFSWLSAAPQLNLNHSLLPAALAQAETYLQTRGDQPIVPNQIALDGLDNFD